MDKVSPSEEQFVAALAARHAALYDQPRRLRHEATSRVVTWRWGVGGRGIGRLAPLWHERNGERRAMPRDRPGRDPEYKYGFDAKGDLVVQLGLTPGCEEVNSMWFRLEGDEATLFVVGGRRSETLALSFEALETQNGRPTRYGRYMSSDRWEIETYRYEGARLSEVEVVGEFGELLGLKHIRQRLVWLPDGELGRVTATDPADEVALSEADRRPFIDQLVDACLEDLATAGTPAILALRYSDAGFSGISALDPRGLDELGGADDIDGWAFVEEWPTEFERAVRTPSPTNLELAHDEADAMYRGVARELALRLKAHGARDLSVVAIPVAADDPPAHARASLMRL